MHAAGGKLRTLFEGSRDVMYQKQSVIWCYAGHMAGVLALLMAAATNRLMLRPPLTDSRDGPFNTVLLYQAGDALMAP